MKVLLGCILINTFFIINILLKNATAYMQLFVKLRLSEILAKKSLKIFKVFSQPGTEHQCAICTVTSLFCDQVSYNASESNTSRGFNKFRNRIMFACDGFVYVYLLLP